MQNDDNALKLVAKHCWAWAQDNVYSIIGGAIFSACITAVVFGLLWFSGKAAVIDPKHRRWVALLIFVPLTFLTVMLVSVWQFHAAQLTAIRAGIGNGVPNLSFEIHNCTFSDYIGDTTRMLVAFELDIINKGGPSVVRKWNCRAKLVSGETVPALQTMTISSDVPVVNRGKTNSMRLKLDTYGPTLLRQDPLPTGGGLPCWVMFAFPFQVKEDLSQSGTEFEVSFEDVSGKKNIQKMTLKAILRQNEYKQ